MIARIVVWSFVGLITVLDVAFAWIHRHTFADWEMNPFALQLRSLVGMQGVLCYRLGSVILAGIVVNKASKPVRSAAEAIVLAVHVALLFIYVHGFVR